MKNQNKTSLYTAILMIFTIIFIPLIVNDANGKISEWKTFKSSVYKFNIEYPSDLKVTNTLYSSHAVISFYNVDVNSNSPYSLTSVILSIFPNNMTLTDFINKQFTNDKIFEIVGEPTPITVAGGPGLAYTTTSSILKSQTKEAVFTHGPFIYYFMVSNSQDLPSTILYDHMLKSIKFLD